MSGRRPWVLLPTKKVGHCGCMTTRETAGRPVAKKAVAKVRAKKVAAKAPAKKAAPKAVATKVGRVPADDPLSTQRVRYLSEVFSGAQLAEWIGVSPSQASRWSRGEERPGPAAAPVLIDLEHVYSRARLVWGGESARIWLGSSAAPSSARMGYQPGPV